MIKRLKCWLKGTHDYKKTESRILGFLETYPAKTCQRCNKTIIDYQEIEVENKEAGYKAPQPIS